MKKNKTIFAVILVVISLLASLKLLSGKNAYFDSGHRPVMGTFADVIALAPDLHTAKDAVEKAFEEFEKVEKLASYYRTDSQINRINQNACKQPVKMSDDIFEVIQKAIKFSELTNGAFDITVAPLVELFKRAEDTNSLPQKNEIEDARSKVGFQKLILDTENKTIRFSVEGMRIDLGGIAKGYAIDTAVEAMKQAGAAGGMVDIGGDIRVFGNPPNGRDCWLISLQNPDTPKTDISKDNYLLVLKLNNTAVATSGDYRRFYFIKGQKFSHIFDTHTGYSANKLSSVSIITENAAKADALATAVSVMGKDKGLNLIEKLPQAEAILLSSANKGKIIKTTGADKYIK